MSKNERKYKYTYKFKHKYIKCVYNLQLTVTSRLVYTSCTTAPTNTYHLNAGFYSGTFWRENFPHNVGSTPNFRSPYDGLLSSG